MVGDPTKKMIAPVPALEMLHISKTFPGVVALDNVDLVVQRGEIHAVVGENGAGKSTLMKILAGVYSRDSGRILLNGREAEIHSPSDALKLGIAVIYQDFPLVAPLSALANVYLGREPTAKLGAIDEKVLRQKYQVLCDDVGVWVDPDARVRDLPVGQRQLVEILKILDRDAQVIVMDEPTASLDQAAKEALFATVQRLKERGRTFIFITHFIDELFQLADRVTILRDGHNVDTLETQLTTPNEIVSLMVGHSVSDMFPRASRRSDGEPILEVRNLTVPNLLHDISFTLRRGEILGLAGLVGSGRSELARAVYGDLPRSQGKVFIEGKEAEINSPHQAIKHGICLLPEDRKREGLVLDFELFKNMSLSALERFSPALVIRFAAERRSAEKYVRSLRISTPSVQQRVRYLSGGNQQKAVVGRMLVTDAKVLILDEPTQGIDVGAKEEIFQLMRQLANEGKGVLFISSEFKEVIGISDRCLVIKNGRLVGEFVRGEMDEGIIMQAAILGA